MVNAKNCTNCGVILEPDELCTLFSVNRNSKVRKSFALVCPACAEKAIRMQFTPMQNCRIRKMPAFYNVGIRFKDPSTGKRVSKSMYIVSETQLPQIYSMANPKDRLTLTDRYGNHIWQPQEVSKALEEGKREFIVASAFLLYNKQTEDEQRTYSTKYRNGVGYNKPDSRFMCGLVKRWLAHDKDYNCLSNDQVEVMRKKLMKYNVQLAYIFNEEED